MASLAQLLEGKLVETSALVVDPFAAMKSETPKSWLRASLQTFLLPEFVQRGFTVVPLNEDDARSRELRSTFPFGRLRRQGQKGLEVVELQLDKHGSAAFRLNIGIAPPGGVDHVAGHIPQEDVWVHYLERYFEMYRFPLIRRWFSVWRLPGSSPNRAAYDSLAKSIVDLIPEIEVALRDGIPGKHMRLVG